MDKNVLDKFGPNMPTFLEHVGTHIPQVVLCSWFLMSPIPLHFKSIVIMQVQTNCFFWLKRNKVKGGSKQKGYLHFQTIYKRTHGFLFIIMTIGINSITMLNQTKVINIVFSIFLFARGNKNARLHQVFVNISSSLISYDCLLQIKKIP